MLLSSAGSYTLGCEITDRSIKIVQLKRSAAGAHIVSLGYTQLKPGIVRNGVIEDFNGLTKSLLSAISKLKGRKLSTKDAVLSLPDSQTFIKTVTIERLTPDESIRSRVKKEIERHFPLNLNDAIFDWQEISETDSHLTLAIAAVEKKVADQYIELCRQVGWHMLALELESVATTRALLGKDLTANAVIIDIGYAHSSLIVVADKTIQFTSSLPVYGSIINETIAHKLKLTPEQAERAKVKCGLDGEKCQGALKIVLDAILDDLAFKVQDALEYRTVNAADSGNPLDKVLLTGGGSYLVGIEEVLSTKLKNTVIKANPLAFVRPLDESTFPEISKTSLHSFVTPIGLALRNVYSTFL